MDNISAFVASLTDADIAALRERLFEPAESAEAIFREIGMPASLLGYEYAREAISMMVGGGHHRKAVCKLYSTIATEYGTTPSKVERAIRKAIETAWDRGDIEAQEKYFGGSVNPRTGKPTNGEFICSIARVISSGAHGAYR